MLFSLVCALARAIILPMNAQKITELVRFALIAALIVIPFRIFIAQPFLVSGNSMFPTFKNNDYLIVDEISYRFREPERGEVIVFRSPVEPNKYLIKRIVGLPTETINGLELKDGEYFVEGDNRGESFDSRFWGALPEENIKGRALIRLWPISSSEFFPGATTTNILP